MVCPPKVRHSAFREMRFPDTRNDVAVQRLVRVCSKAFSGCRRTSRSDNHRTVSARKIWICTLWFPLLILFAPHIPNTQYPVIHSSYGPHDIRIARRTSRSTRFAQAFPISSLVLLATPRVNSTSLPFSPPSRALPLPVLALSASLVYIPSR